MATRLYVAIRRVISLRRVPVASAVRVVVDTASGKKSTWARLTRLVPDSVTITGPRRVVNAVSSVSTVYQTVTVHDTGDFVIPLDMKGLAAGVRVKPTEVRVLVQMPPLTRRPRDPALLSASGVK